MKLFSVSQMVAAEQLAAEGGHSYEAMMEAAGRGVAEAVIARYPVEGKAILALVGPGNNGGDALVAGRYLHWAGANVVFYLYSDRDPAQDLNMAQVLEEGIPVLQQMDDQRFRVLRLRLNGVDMVLDGLLGTGVTRRIDGEMAKLLRQVKGGLDERERLAANEVAEARRSEGFEIPLAPVRPDLTRPDAPAWRPLVVAVDCPSGLNCDTGEVDPLTLPAGLTVTFAGPKRGHFAFPGADFCGELVVADIGIEPRHTAGVAVEVATVDQVSRWLPARPADGHKGSFGRVLIAAGSGAYRGAPILAGRGALRAGAGLVALAVPEVVRTAAVAVLPEATYVPLEAGEILDEAAAGRVFAGGGRYEALLCGPGLSPAARPFLLPFLEQLRQGEEPAPLVLDADALNLLAAEANWPALLPPGAILTPHPGEMARLCGLTLSEIKERDRIALAAEKAAAWGCVLLLKGAFTVVAAPDGAVRLIPFANPLLATAGSGDVLAGVILALLGQGVAPFPAAVCGAYLHAAAAELARDRFGSAGLLAGELADWLPMALERLQLFGE